MRYFTFPETGDYVVDCEAGRMRAETLIQEMRESGFTPGLGYAVMEAVDSGKFDGRHVGFFHAIAERLVE